MRTFFLQSYINVYHYYTMKQKEPLTKPIPVRLPASMRLRVMAAAKSLGANSSSVVRLALIQQLDEIERGHIRIKPVA
jgi:hypothetical protein